MLSSKSVIIRYAICLCCFLLSGSGTITGWPATICGVIGTIELGTALLQYSPLCEILAGSDVKAPGSMEDKPSYSNYPNVQPNLNKAV